MCIPFAQVRARGVYAGCSAAHIPPLPLRQGERKVLKKHDMSCNRSRDGIRGGPGGRGGWAGVDFTVVDRGLSAHNKRVNVLQMLTERT